MAARPATISLLQVAIFLFSALNCPAVLSENKQIAMAVPDKALSQIFVRSSGWTGADGAYSIPLNTNKTIWLFGDTFIGELRKNKRIDTTIINNSIGMQSLGRESTMHFYWRTISKKADSIFTSTDKDKWFWPADGVCLGNRRLYQFLHRIKRKPGDNSAWGFLDDGDFLAFVSNADSAPDKWQYSIKPLPAGISWAKAVLSDGDWLYVYCAYPKAAKGYFKHPVIVARIQKKRLQEADISSWQYWCNTSTADSDGSWKETLKDPIILMQDGAPEMSVCRVRGMNGYYAVYFPAGLGPTIAIRQAERPEGPWTEPQTVYRCREDSKKIFVYSAKAHPELAKKDGELPITYCSNTETLEANFENADIYVPRGLRLQLK